MGVGVTMGGRDRATELAREWRELLREQAHSGLPAAKFCRGRGLPVHKFYSWKHRLKGSSSIEVEEAGGSRGAGGAAPGGESGVSSSGADDASAPAGVFARVVVGEGAAATGGLAAGAGGGAQIVLPGGALVRLDPGVDRGLLRAILEELRRPC